MLMRVFLGWLRGERGPWGRERESLVDERSRITNRMKSALARLGIRGFKPHLRKAPERLAGLRTAEGTGLPANIIQEVRRDMATRGHGRAGKHHRGVPARHGSAGTGP